MRNPRPLGGIVWLASYPKSGNTWLRALLTNALRDSRSPADINGLLGANAASRKLFDEWSGAKSSDLLPAEAESARPHVYEALARGTDGAIFMKAHDACVTTPVGDPLFPASATRAAIYMVRHPADVAISYAHHRGCTIDEALRLMADSNHRLADGKTGVEGQLPQRLLSWGEHVSSWLDSPLPVLCVRYEDMHAAPENTLRIILEFLGEDPDPMRIERAVRFASFPELSRQESDRGFHERPGRMRAFFRAGKPGEGVGLTASQTQSINYDYYGVIKRLGYGGSYD